MAGKTVRDRLGTALFDARAAVTFALVDVVAVAAAAVALLPLLLRGKPAGTRWRAPASPRPAVEPALAGEADDAADESPAGSP